MIHPGVGPPVVREAHMGGRLLFAGAESATISPGLIEGAFDAAERVAAAIEAAP
jgi:monoamine oxidase